jgi:uncharacterized protein (TIGR02391 family)
MKNEAEKQEIIRELKKFYEELRSYKNRQSRRHNSKFSEAQIRSLDALRLKLQRDHGRLLNIIFEHGGSAYIPYLNRNYEVFSYSLDSLDMHPRGLEALDGAISVVNRAIGKLQSLTLLETSHVQVPEDSAQMANFLFDKMQFHSRVITASKSLFESGHYAQAIFEAFKAVENFVQDKSGLTTYGTNLMESVFNEENPIIKVPEAGHYYKEVQKGFKHLFVGASQGIRNPKAHKEIIQKDPYITLQYLGFFSFLLKRIDYWETGVS